jgi:hypothetical protein
MSVIYLGTPKYTHIYTSLFEFHQQSLNKAVDDLNWAQIKPDFLPPPRHDCHLISGINFSYQGSIA